MHATTQLMQDQPRRGLKPGQRHSGQFRKGDDPRRPHGLTLTDGVTFAAKARELGPAILDFWDALWRNEAAPLPVRLRASELIVERGHGKAVSVIDMSITNSRPLVTLSVEELEAIASGEQPRFPIAVEGEVIEATFTTVDTTDDET
jgi:hypothetical protein